MRRLGGHAGALGREGYLGRPCRPPGDFLASMAESGASRHAHPASLGARFRSAFVVRCRGMILACSPLSGSIRVRHSRHRSDSARSCVDLRGRGAPRNGHGSRIPSTTTICGPVHRNRRVCVPRTVENGLGPSVFVVLRHAAPRASAESRMAPQVPQNGVRPRPQGHPRLKFGDRIASVSSGDVPVARRSG